MSALTPKDKAFIFATVLDNKYIKLRPTPKQLRFLLCQEEEAFYGGAAGGGKSIAMLMAALQYVEHPEYSALVLRRTLPELESPPSGLMVVAKDWLMGSDAKMSEGGRIWTFPSGATLTFGYLADENDKYRYQGTEYQFVGFDELSQFTESQYTYLFSRLRRTKDNPIPSRMRATSNPGGVGHEWVKDRFITNPQAVFIPARLEDNPYLESGEYARNLDRLDPVTRAQLREGNWDIQAAGNYFKPHWWKVVDVAPAQVRSVRYWDLAATEEGDWTAGAKVSTANGQYWVQDIRRVRATPLEIEQLVKQTAQLDGVNVPIHIEQEPGSSGVNTISHYQRDVLAGYAVYGDRVTGSKVERAGPASSAAQAGNIFLVNGSWVRPFIDEASLFPEGAHDDMVDAVSGALSKLASQNANRFLAGKVGKYR